MKKLWSVLMVVSVLILSMAGCGSDDRMQYPWKVEKTSKNIQNKYESVTLELVDDSMTTEGAQFVLNNKGDEEISFGTEWFIQLYEDGAWYDITIENVDWTGELITVKSNQEYLFETDWSSAYGELPYGKYRMVKQYTMENNSSFVFCEFEIS